MIKKNKWIYALLGIFIMNLFSIKFAFASNGEASTNLYIAVAGPMSGSKKYKGLEILEPIKMYIEKINHRGGINGKTIKLLVFDDQDKVDIGLQKAKEIERSKALIVLGHRSSNVCIAVGKYYKDKKIPVITSTATADLVTKNNDWYFRGIISNSGQGKFLSYYIKNILHKDNISIIYDQDEYGKSLVSAFEKSATFLKLSIDKKWSFQKEGVTKNSLNQTFKKIALEVQKKNDVQTIFLAVHDVEAAPIIKQIKDLNLNIMFIGGASIGKATFWKRFLKYPEERLSPGYYSDGIYAVTNFMFDTSNQHAQEFRRLFINKYQKKPHTASAASYDIIAIAIEALKHAGISGDVKTDRVKIKNYLASINTLQNAFPGVTGLTYFDNDGNAVRNTSPIGIFDRQKFISAPIQISEINNLREIATIKTKIKTSQDNVQDKSLVSNGNKLFRQTKVVYTGLELNTVSDLNMDDMVCHLDFHIWFRFAGELNFKDIRFNNAVEPIVLDKPSIIKNSMIHFGSEYNYRLFHVQGKFKMNFYDTLLPYGRHLLGFSLKHKRLSREHIIFATDVLSMDFSEDLNLKNILSSTSKWKIYKSQFFQDTEKCNIYGNPDLLNNTSKKFINYSRFNTLVFIEPNNFTLRRNFAESTAPYIFTSSLAIFICIFSFYSFFKKTALLFVVQLILISILLHSSEILILNFLLDKINKQFFSYVFIFYDILWWMFPAIYLCKGIEQFLWIPLEKKTKHEVPQLVRHCVSIIVYVLFFFCIIAFVFDQKITSLLASTGVIAMIIGLAIQINISNIFSGIAIAMEQPFALDDWVKIGDFDEAKVVGMNWRTTQFQKRDNTIMSIPNSEVGSASLINYQQQGNVYELLIRLHVDPAHDPERVIKIILDVLNLSPLVVKKYKPICRFNGYTEYSGEYVVIPIFCDYSKKNIHKGDIILHIWKELHRAGIRQAINLSEFHMIKGKKKGGEKKTNMLSFVEGVDIFKALPKEAKIYLSQCMRHKRYKAGETIVKDGDVANSLFIIVEGTVSINVNVGNGEYIETNRIGAGNYFGEMALLTGAPRTANIVAISDTVICEITRSDIATFVEKYPKINTNFNEKLSRRIKENEKIIKKNKEIKQKRKESNTDFHKKIMKFFGG